MLTQREEQQEATIKRHRSNTRIAPPWDGTPAIGSATGPPQRAQGNRRDTLLMIRLRDVLVTAGICAFETLDTATDLALGDSYRFDRTAALHRVDCETRGGFVRIQRATPPAVGSRDLLVKTGLRATLISHHGHLAEGILGHPQISPATPVLLLPYSLDRHITHDLIAMHTL